MRLTRTTASFAAVIACAAGAIAVIATDKHDTPPQEVLLSEDFQSGAFSAWDLRQSAAPDRISLVSSPESQEDRVARFEVRGGDRWMGERDARAEIGWTGRYASEGDLMTYRWSTRFDRSFPTSAEFQDVTQWKNEGTGSPPLQIKVEDEEVALQAGEQANYAKLWRTPLERERWMDFELRVLWSEDPRRGWVELDRDGAAVLRRTEFATLFEGDRNYFKLGLYRSADIGPTGVVLHDDVLITRQPGHAAGTRPK